jgi:hypothetical protein
MNSKKTKQIKREIYGDFSPRFRKYTRLPNGQIIADPKRLAYQKVKKDYFKGK